MDKRLEVYCGFFDPETSEISGQSYPVWDVLEAAVLIVRMRPDDWEVRHDGKVSDYMERCVKILSDRLHGGMRDIHAGAAFKRGQYHGKPNH